MQFGDAEGPGHAVLLAILGGEDESLDLLPDTFHRDLGLVRMRVREQDAEFVSALARREVTAADSVTEASANRLAGDGHHYLFVPRNYLFG